jgi:hypothetical protein
MDGAVRLSPLLFTNAGASRRPMQGRQALLLVLSSHQLDRDVGYRSP